MSDKIIAYISTVNKPEMADYTIAPGVTEKCIQTNEAPVLSLLRQNKQIREILCICTPEVWSLHEGLGMSAMERFRKTIAAKFPGMTYTVIDYPEDADFEGDILPQILQEIGENDKIYLETTGGNRSAVAQLQLVCRVLKYKGIRIAGAVYSDKNKHTVQDVTASYLYFDLINGMNEFSETGSANTLQAYFKDTGNAPGAALAKAMQELTDAIALCRTMQEIQSRLAAYNTALAAAAACEDPMLRLLLPIFTQKYERMETITDVVRWCAKNGMVQQGVTIFKELIPEYLVEEKHVFTQYPLTDKYNNPLTVSDIWQGAPHIDWKNWNITLWNGYESLLSKPDCSGHLQVNQSLGIVSADYEAIRRLRNQFSHVSDSVNGNKWNKYFEKNCYDGARRYPVNLETTEMQELRCFLRKAADHVDALVKELERKQQQNTGA